MTSDKYVIGVIMNVFTEIFRLSKDVVDQSLDLSDSLVKSWLPKFEIFHVFFSILLDLLCFFVDPTSSCFVIMLK